MKKIFNHLYALVLYRFILLLLVYSIIRIIYYLCNLGLYTDISTSHLFILLGAGIPFDITAILYINLLYLLLQIIPFQFRYNISYQKILKVLFIVSNSFFLFFNFVDIVFSRFTLRRTTFSVFKEFRNEADNFSLIGQLFKDYWWVVVLWIVFTVILAYTYGPTRVQRPQIKSALLFYLSRTCIMLAFLFGIFVGLRGHLNFHLKPMNINDSAKKVNKAIESNIVLNTSFTFIRTLSSEKLRTLNYFTNEEVDKIYNPIHIPEPKGDFKNKNVFIIILESFSKSSIGYYTKQINPDYAGFTPFLDSLITQSYSFKYSFANAYRSGPAIPVIIAGMPSLMNEFYLLSAYSNNRIMGLGTLLAKKGYDCSFFHGADNGSLKFDRFSNVAGYQHYYGRTEYNNEKDYDGAWGIFDEPFMQFAARTVDAKQKPFLATLFTLSSHHPYILPEKYKGKFQKGTDPIYEMISYTDNALRNFFNTASKMDWYENTLFVVLADHTAAVQYPEFSTEAGRMSIPIIFYDPSGEFPVGENDTTVMQQLDIIPTIMDYLQYDEPYFSFGYPIFDPNHKNFAITYQGGIYQFIYENYLYRFDMQSPIALFDYRKDVLHNHNLLKEGMKVPGAVDTLSKAFLQQYNNRLNRHETTIE